MQKIDDLIQSFQRGIFVRFKDFFFFFLLFGEKHNPLEDNWLVPKIYHS